MESSQDKKQPQRSALQALAPIPPPHPARDITPRATTTRGALRRDRPSRVAQAATLRSEPSPA